MDPRWPRKMSSSGSTSRRTNSSPRSSTCAASPRSGPRTEGRGKERRPTSFAGGSRTSGSRRGGAMGGAVACGAGGKPPNVVVRSGKGNRLWFLCHLDVVPPGDAPAWRVDPFKPKLMDGRVYGRGTEDNGQAVAAVLGAYRAVLDAGATLGRSIGLAFVADEETGSGHGAKFLLEQGLFGAKDTFLMPDRGASDGDEIEAAEQSLLWLRATVRGKQAHASRPDQGANAHRAGAFLLTLIDATLPKRFPGSDARFCPSTSQCV